MPRRIPTPCTAPGCEHLNPCPVHRKNRQSARAKGYDSKWERTSKAYLYENPLCECDTHLEVPPLERPRAKHVDHIDGLGPNGLRGFDWTNLRALSHSCHSKSTTKTHPGGWNAR